MYLKSLELQGFKSFPDKIELKFNKGITAVVGPNGSGKSNIGDAMRWVMGEQSSKALRGEKMAGVIFHGTQTRPKAPFAQVTITIDNEDGALEYDSDTVSVSRKLYRNGDSFYMINGKEVNLKDIVELFMDTGLGRDGYSIIGQGRIADIVNGKSNDRREIFEEAAGISKFRSKKKEAEKKLAAAEDNLSRINDIMGEIEGRIGPLKAQAEKAEKFRVLDEEKRKLEVSVWVHKLNEYMSQIAGYEEKLSAVKKEYEVITQELESIEDDINDSFAKSAEKSELADSYKNQIHQVELENSQALSKIAVYENDISHLEDNILKLKEQISESNSSKYYLEAELKTRRQELEELDEKKAKQQEAVDCKEKELSELIDKTALSDKSVSEAGSFINEL
ncbi:chromosome segregation SMC family protein, partial [Ruminococcus bicirculans (ex Wegman et al. 2014)]|uniref:chromosome segregation SMC family protein n=2 Tax=Ruminococcus TaxID=1263 RepID=UPI00402744D3